jgi:hypothetical protein
VWVVQLTVLGEAECLMSTVSLHLLILAQVAVAQVAETLLVLAVTVVLELQS